MRDTFSKHQSLDGTQGEVECSVLKFQNLVLALYKVGSELQRRFFEDFYEGSV